MAGFRPPDLAPVVMPTRREATSVQPVSLPGSNATVHAAPPVEEGRHDIEIALVCQSNMNRSMEAHDVLQQRGYRVRSYGAGSKIRIPGESEWKPNIYDFGTTYAYILADLVKKNQARYTKNGMLAMVERDRKVKDRPERWQDEKAQFDLVITYEQRVFDIVVADLSSRGGVELRPVHVVNIGTTDTHAEAKTGAALTYDLVKMLYDSSDWESEISSILDRFETRAGKPILHTLVFY